MVEIRILPFRGHTQRKLNRALSLGSALCAGLLVSLAATARPSYAQTSNPLPELESTASDSALSDTRFECQLFNNEYTVMYKPESQPEQAYAWATPSAMGGGWTAENRCYAISDRLENYRPEGLVDLQVGKENGYDIVCATTEQSPGQCKIVFTVPPGQNAVVTRDRVFENLTLADGGTETTIVNTFTGEGSSDILGQISEVLGTQGFPVPNGSARSSRGINLKPFLDTADGGTGAELGSNTAGRTLNPDNFR